MINKKLQLNHLYIFLSLFFIVSNIFGHNENSYLFNSTTEIIILNLLFIFAVLNSSKDNIFLKIFLIYFFIYLINIYLIPLPDYRSHYISRDTSILNISKSINILSIHFFTLFLIIKIIFNNNSKIILRDVKSKDLNYIFLSSFGLILISLGALYLIMKLDYNFFFLKILSVVLSLDKMLLSISCLLIIFWNRIHPSIKILCISAILMCISFDFLNNSKSSIFYFFLLVVMCYFYLKNENYINLKFILIVSFLLISSLFAYFFALNKLSSIKDFGDIIIFIYSFFNRLAFFEFYLEKNTLVHYEEIMNLSYNIKAFIDKITPGFDPYGIPLMKNQLHYLWHYYDGINYSGTVSEQSTLFALSNRIFGYYYFLYYLLILSLFKILYDKIFFLQLEQKIVVKFTMLYLFIVWLDGFGIDFFLMNILYTSIFLIILFSTSNLLKKIFN